MSDHCQGYVLLENDLTLTCNLAPYHARESHSMSLQTPNGAVVTVRWEMEPTAWIDGPDG